MIPIEPRVHLVLLHTDGLGFRVPIVIQLYFDNFRYRLRAGSQWHFRVAVKEVKSGSHS